MQLVVDQYWKVELEEEKDDKIQLEEFKEKDRRRRDKLERIGD